MGSLNADFLRGLAWYCSLTLDKSVVRALGDVSVVCFKKIPNFGPYCIKAGNACVAVLKVAPGMESVSQIGRLKVATQYGTVKEKANTALAAAAMRSGIPQTDLEEIAASAMGLSADGTLRVKLGAFAAEIRIASGTSTEIRWFEADGTPVKNLPDAAKKTHAAALLKIKNTAAAIKKMLLPARARIEEFFMIDRSWSFGDCTSVT